MAQNEPVKLSQDGSAKLASNFGEAFTSGPLVVKCFVRDAIFCYKREFVCIWYLCLYMKHMFAYDTDI